MGLFSKPRKAREDPIQPEERETIRRCIKPGDVVFDVGAHEGLWSEAVLAIHGRAEMHVFEASSATFARVSERLGKRARVNHLAASNHVGEITFHTYNDDSRLSSIYRRKSVEADILPGGFKSETIPATTMDAYWADERRQINFLKIDVEGAEYDVLRGANRLLKRAQVDYLQFEYGGTFLDAGVSLRNVWSFLRRSGYRVFSVKGRKFTEVKTFTKSLETYQYSNFMAVHERLANRFTGDKEEIELFTDEIARHGIDLRGVVQVGAHQGQEVAAFRDLKLNPIVLVEANPELAKSLRDKYAGADDVVVIEGAASDSEGIADFHLASMDQSSSLLRAAKHSELYPKIKFDRDIQVRTFALDQALAEAGIDASLLNLLVMDIQGAELMALRGAIGLLSHIEAIQLEVNFDNVYEDCPQIADLDEFLEATGFLRVLTRTPYSADWGDGVYVRRPMITNSRLGEMGRFANQAFQYAFLRSYAHEQGYDFANPPWVGERIFNVQPGRDDLPHMRFSVHKEGLRLSDCEIANSETTLPNTDVAGYFQYNMHYYAPDREMLLDDFSFRAPYDEYARRIRAGFEAAPGPVAAVHLRRGDYGYGHFFIPPNEWYVDWLRGLRQDHPDLSIYVATDDAGAAATDFDEFPRIGAGDPGLPEHGPDFFPDFAALACADYVGIANSSFSFLAAILNQHAQGFARPSLPERGMIGFEPWKSEPLLYDATAEESGEEFMSAHAKSRSKYRIQKFFRFVK